jgi:ABC-type sugar transport system substrate-binding protein
MDSFTATAAAALVQQQNLSVPLVAYDAEPDHVALLKKGVFKDLISQNPGQKIRLAIQLIATHQLTGALPQMRDQMFESVIIDGSSSKADLKKYTYLPAN